MSKIFLVFTKFESSSSSNRNLLDSRKMDQAESEFVQLWQSLKQYTTPRSKLYEIILEQLESLKELVETGWSPREEILVTKLKIEERQDKLISSTISFRANLCGYDKCLKDQAQKLVLKNELDEKRIFTKKRVQIIDTKFL